MSIHRVSTEIEGKVWTLETGHLARQAGGAVMVRVGDTLVLVTAVVSPEVKEGVDFLPLTVDYVEKTFAAGKIPGGFFKREGKPSEKETLTSRFIDRPIRPLFPDYYHHETQIIATVLSADADHDPDVLAIVGASTALMISEAPFLGPVAGCRVGRVNGQWFVNASSEKMALSDIDLIVAASEEAVVMVEGGASEVTEQEILEGIVLAHRSLMPLLKIQRELAGLVKKEKMVLSVPLEDHDLKDAVHAKIAGSLSKAMCISEKRKRHEALRQIEEGLVQDFGLYEEGMEKKRKAVELIYEDTKREVVRNRILSEKVRLDGRSLRDVRPIACEVGLLPRTHGSALFTRGETQALVVTTLGTSEDVQIIDTLMEEGQKKFMLHYNFPPFSVGEVKFLRAPGRREIGHGALAERAVKKVMPSEERFPYTVRIVSEILESNGSSSMATVCGASLSLMDAGVPTCAAVAGIAMGLIKEGDRFAILSDILGDEDHLGDMDFKVAGTQKGITAIQMDIKIAGLTHELLSLALDQAREGRLYILEKMNQALSLPRAELSQYAPRVESLRIPKNKIKDLIGPQGKIIKGIIELTGVKIDVEDDGQVQIFSSDANALEQARQIVKYITASPEEGKIYEGKVQKIMDFGAFVEILPGQDGLLHVSQIDEKRVQNVSDVLKEGDIVTVKVIQIDPEGKIRLSRKAASGLKPDIVPMKLPKF